MASFRDSFMLTSTKSMPDFAQSYDDRMSYAHRSTRISPSSPTPGGPPVITFSHVPTGPEFLEAVKACDVDAVREFLAAGVVEKWGREGPEEDRLQSEEALLEVMLGYTDEAGDTCLHWAVRKCHQDMCILLVEMGADPYARNLHQETPFSLASPLLQGVITTAQEVKSLLRSRMENQLSNRFMLMDF